MTETKSGVTIGHVAVFADVFGNLKDGGAPPDSAVGSVTSVSVVSANGLAGTVTNPTSTPAITLSTTATGVLKGNGTAISAAVAGTDYAPATSGTSLLKGDGAGGTTAATETDVTGKTLTGYVSGAGTISASDTILTAIEKLNGNTSALTGAIVYTGTWNASTNSPALASGVGTKGVLYKVGVAGTTTIDGISQWNVGDSIVFNGTTWDKIDGLANEVISVQGSTGVVVITDANLSTSDVTTNNVSTSKHGFAPKLPNNAAVYLDGTGAYSTPTGAVTSVQGSTGAVTITDANLSTSDITTNDVSITKHGFAPKAPNDSTKFLNGQGAWTVPAGGSAGNSAMEFSSLQSGSGIGPNTTRYLTIGNDQSALGTAYLRVPFAGTITAMFASTPFAGPGAGNTFTYTVNKNNVDTAITCQTTNGNTDSNDTSHSVAVAQGDAITIKVVTSTSANQTLHYVTLCLKS